MSQQSGNFIFHPLQNGSLTHNHSTGKSSGYPNIVQYKPDGVSGIFAPRIVVHGRNYSSNQGTNQNNSLPEASNSHTHFDAHYPAGQTVSAQRQQLAAEQAAQKERDDLYAKLFGSLLTGGDSGSGTEANREDNNYYELLSARMERVQECEQDGTKRIQNYSICPPNDIVGEHIMKDTIVCCKKPTSLGGTGTGSGIDNSGDSTNSSTDGSGVTSGSGTTTTTTTINDKCSGSKPEIPTWFEYDVASEKECQLCDIIKSNNYEHCIKDGKKLPDHECKQNYQFRGINNGKLPQPCINNKCRNIQAQEAGKDPTTMAHELGMPTMKNSRGSNYTINTDPTYPLDENKELKCKDNKDCCWKHRGSENACNNDKNCVWCKSEDPNPKHCKVIKMANNQDKKFKVGDDNHNMLICSGGYSSTCLPRAKDGKPVNYLPFKNQDLYFNKEGGGQMRQEDKTGSGKQAWVIDYPLQCGKTLDEELEHKKEESQKCRANMNLQENQRNKWWWFCKKNSDSECCTNNRGGNCT